MGGEADLNLRTFTNDHNREGIFLSIVLVTGACATDIRCVAELRQLFFLVEAFKVFRAFFLKMLRYIH